MTRPCDRRLVIFDFDGTIADTVDGILRTARPILLAHGIKEEGLGDMRRIVGPPFPQAFSMVYGFSPEEADQITAEYRSVYGEGGIELWPTYPGIPELLASLRASGRLLAVASSKRDVLVRRALSDEGIAEDFDVVMGKLDDKGDTKPATIRRCLEALDVPPSDAIMVGDRFYDVDAAREAGIPCVGVHYGRTCEREELERAGACAVAETVGELARVLLGGSV